MIGVDDAAKLADFGVSALANDDDKLKSTEGTYFFMAPEALDKEAAKTGFSGIKADIWSLGITFYAFIYLKLPYYSANIYKINEVIQNTE